MVRPELLLLVRALGRLGRDLRVVVEDVKGKCTSGMAPGVHFLLRSGRLYLPAEALDRAGVPPVFLPGLETAVWFGDPEAKRVAIRELGRARHIPAQMACIDAAYDHPRLVDDVILALGGEAIEMGGRYLYAAVTTDTIRPESVNGDKQHIPRCDLLLRAATASSSA